MVISDATELGALVRKTRTAQSLSQSELAQKVGTTRQWLSRFEQGSNDVSLALVIDILRALDIQISAHAPQDNATEELAPEPLASGQQPAAKVQTAEPPAPTPLAVPSLPTKPTGAKDRRAMLRTRDSLAGLKLPSLPTKNEALADSQTVPHDQEDPHKQIKPPTPRRVTSTGREAAGYSIDRDIARISQSTLFNRGKRPPQGHSK